MSHVSRLRLLLLAAASLGVSGVLAVAPSSAAADSTPSNASGTPAGYPTPSGIQTVTLKPISGAAATPDAGVIVCSVNLNEYVHYSKPGNDVSWHGSWSCDSTVNAYVTSSDYYDNFPVVTTQNNSTGASGSFNPRYNGCLTGYWYGVASYYFSWPGYTPASGEGTSPTNYITCP